MGRWEEGNPRLISLCVSGLESDLRIAPCSPTCNRNQSSLAVAPILGSTYVNGTGTDGSGRSGRKLELLCCYYFISCFQTSVALNLCLAFVANCLVCKLVELGCRGHGWRGRRTRRR